MNSTRAKKLTKKPLLLVVAMSLLTISLVMSRAHANASAMALSPDAAAYEASLQVAELLPEGLEFWDEGLLGVAPPPPPISRFLP